MELARDTAEKLRDEGRGIILDQFANPDNPLAHYEGTGPEIWRDTQGRITHFISSMGTTGTIMGCSRFFKEKNPEYPDHRRAAGRRRADSRHPQMAASLSAENLQRQECGSAGERQPAGCGGIHPPLGARGRHLLRHLLRRRTGRGAAHFAAGRERDHRVHRVRPRGSLSEHGGVSGVMRVGVPQSWGNNCGFHTISHRWLSGS